MIRLARVKTNTNTNGEMKEKNRPDIKWERKVAGRERERKKGNRILGRSKKFTSFFGLFDQDKHKPNSQNG